MKRLARLFLACGVLSMMPRNALPQAAPPPARQSAPAAADPTWAVPNRDQVNQGTVTVITAPAGGAMSVFGSDMARVLDDNETIRVLPVLGKGPVQNVLDVLYLKSIDMGLVTSDVPEFYKLQYKMNDVASRIRYIAKLYHNEIHILAPTSIRSIYDLEGKRIMAAKDVGFYSAKVIFSRLNINATFDYKTDDARSIQLLVDGEADAYIGSTGKPFPLLRIIKNENRSLHLVPVPYDPRLQDLYLPSKFSSDDYPSLMSPGETVDTVAASVLLVSFNWPENTERYVKVARFVNAFFSKIDEFYKPPRHPKWRESSISVDVPGWQRFKAAQDWLEQHGKTSQQAFKQFLGEKGRPGNLSEAEISKLYDEFVKWNRANNR